MKFVIVLSTLLALATATRLPFQKSDIQNEMLPQNESSQEQEKCSSIVNSFDAIVKVLKNYTNSLTVNKELSNIRNEISIPDTMNIGSNSDTYFTSITVKGLKNFESENITMSWGEDSVYAENSWETLTVNGMFHYINPAGKESGVFEIVIVEPEYSGNTSLTTNANIYPMMSPASSVIFRKVIISHAQLSEIFQNEKPQFDYLLRNVICQYIANAVAENMYNDITMRIRKTVMPYLTYPNKNIADDDTSFNGQLPNGKNFELKNIRFDNAKNNLAKISFVQMNHTDINNTAKLQLRLLDLNGECDLTITAEDKNYNSKVTFKFERVKIIPTLNFNDKTVYTDVLIKNPQIEINPQNSDATALMNAKEQLIKDFIGCFIQTMAENTNQHIQKTLNTLS